jgi:urease accessory protein
VIRAHTLLHGADRGDAQTLTVRLGFDDRHRRRLAVTAAGGERVLLDLGEATRLRDGDRLAMDDGRVLLVEAEPEPVADIYASDPTALARLAWHLGNRHTPTAVLPDRLRIRRDHVLEAMVERLGGTVDRTTAPFDPEAGAYHDGGGHGHHHHHHHGEGDGHHHA